ncbi:leucine-rich repeat-containing protein 66 isoform X3 [Labrus mixtus]|uniref:leucine-rich repeat-containing protein 66 isoform X3 n=1 Tax=Labrus mixtus TaxID=508554 RepID=UPI0029C0183B|nr:leucine-rich repeat-containing protein 66 isoform X3 [Labrus mixtus]
MAVAQVLLLAAVLLRCSSAVPACPQSCTCQSPDLLNCSSSGLTFVPQHIPDSVTELDLSDNLLDSVTISRRQDQLRNVWLGNNRITRLSLCLERSLGGRYVTGRRLHHSSGPWQKRRCVPWARTLQLLSVERNQLEQLPEGLQSCESLQVLQLSFNRISTLRPQDFSNLQQLKELNLKHNLLTSLHPQTFVGLSQLQVTLIVQDMHTV